jgi:hypothetical protein
VSAAPSSHCRDPSSLTRSVEIGDPYDGPLAYRQGKPMRPDVAAAFDPPAAYAWLEANAPRFHFIKRYSYEPWHYEVR